MLRTAPIRWILALAIFGTQIGPGVCALVCASSMGREAHASTTSHKTVEQCLAPCCTGRKTHTGVPAIDSWKAGVNCCAWIAQAQAPTATLKSKMAVPTVDLIAVLPALVVVVALPVERPGRGESGIDRARSPTWQQSFHSRAPPGLDA